MKTELEAARSQCKALQESHELAMQDALDNTRGVLSFKIESLRKSASDLMAEKQDLEIEVQTLRNQIELSNFGKLNSDKVKVTRRGSMLTT